MYLFVSEVKTVDGMEGARVIENVPVFVGTETWCFGSFLLVLCL